MVSEDCDGEPSSRRGLFRAAGAGLAGALAAGCGNQSLKAQVHNAQPVLDTDVELLNNLLYLEHMAIAAYTAGTPLLASSVGKAGQLFLNHELAHSGALTWMVKAAGGDPITPPPSYDLGHPRTSDEVLALLHEVENAQLSAYLRAIPRLAPGFVKATVASILANDAQHVAVVRAALHKPAVPSALVTGQD